MLFGLFAVIFGCATADYAQTRPIVGGYKTVSVTDAVVAEAADFAVGDYSQKNDVSLEIVSIEKAERQAVQGTNYRLCIEVKITGEDDGDTQFVQATVFQNLKKEFTLKSWDADACGKK